MFCKKCGTKQKDGQKFCPKCGEPYLDENGKPYLKGVRKDIQDAKEKLTSKVDELTQQGKKLIDEKVQPQLNDKIEGLRNADWDKKKKKASSFINDVYRRYANARTTTKAFLIGCVILLLFLLFGKSHCAKSGSSLFQEKAPQEDFVSLLDNPSTAFTVRIDKRLGSGGGFVGWVEVPEGMGSKDNSYIWTLIFFPENDSKKSGRAVIEAWLIDRAAWANTYTKTYRYEIRDDIVELYNGSYRPSFDEGWKRDKDIRLYIEKEGESFNLRGEFLEKERLFKQSQYIAAPDKNRHYINR